MAVLMSTMICLENLISFQNTFLSRSEYRIIQELQTVTIFNPFPYRLFKPKHSEAKHIQTTSDRLLY